MKAIILAGGTGSRLYPLTSVMNKQLLPLFDKPMIYYPLTVLMAAGVKDFCIITGPDAVKKYETLLGDGHEWGIAIEYRVQKKPLGIAHSLLTAKDFIADQNVILMLGDNILFGGNSISEAISTFRSGAKIFAYRVNNPGDYGVVEFDANNEVISLEEKPDKPRSSFAVPGVYIYDSTVVRHAQSLRPSPRGELEITDVNNRYLEAGELQVERLSRGSVWLDAGTSTGLHEAASYVETIEKRQGVKLGCPEEAALVRSYVNARQFGDLLGAMPDCDYRDYLETLLRDQAVSASWP